MRIASLFILIMCFYSFFSVSEALAEEKLLVDAYVVVKSDTTPMDGAGIVIFPNSIEEITDTKIQEISPHLYLVSFPITKEQLDSGASFNAVLKDEQNNYSFGLMKSAETVIFPEIIDECPPKDPSNALRQTTNAATYENIIKLRTVRRDNEKEIFQKTLDDTTNEHLSGLAKELKINITGNLKDENLSPIDLVFQLNKLEHALRTYLATPNKKAK